MSYLFDQLKSIDDKPKEEDKILLMGLQAAGKTAIKDVVFFNKLPDDVADYMATIHYERQYLDEEKGSLVIDSGGQESYWNEAVTHFRHLVFSNVKLLLWIVDTTRPELFEESERRFSFTIRQFKKENPKGNICVLCHKVDQITPEDLVPLLQKVREIFDDPKFKIRFEASSIFYTESLKELVFSLMKEANMNIERFELVSNIGKKIEDSDEFQSYKLEHKGDPRIQQLLDYLNPSVDSVRATFGEVSKEFDLSEYDIVEIVLIDKNTLSPIFGTSSPGAVSIDNSMNYMMALQEFKEIIKENKINGESEATVVTSSDQKVHALVFNMESNFLLLTSMKEITDARTKKFYDLIKEFSKSVDLKQVEKIEEKISTRSSIDDKRISIKEEIAPPIATKPIAKEPETRTTPIPLETTKLPEIKDVLSQDILSEDINLASEDTKFTFLKKMSEEKKERDKEYLEKLQEEEIREEKSQKVEPPIIQEEISEKIVEDKDEEVKPPIIEEVEIVTEKEISIEDKTEEPLEITKEKEEIIEKPIIIEPESEEELEQQITEEKEPIDLSKPTDEIKEEKDDKEQQPKSRFVQRLKEESKRYKIRQIKLEKLKQELSDETLDLTEKDIEELAKFLKEKSSSDE